MIANKYSHIVNLSGKPCRGNHALCYCIKYRLLKIFLRFGHWKSGKTDDLSREKSRVENYDVTFFPFATIWNLVFRKLRFKFREKNADYNLNGGQYLCWCLIVYFLSVRFNWKLIQRQKTLQFLVFRLMRKVIYIFFR